MKVYLDNCCYNRPYDDQGSIIVRFEVDAKLYIQELVKSEKLDLIWSFVMDYENSKNPFSDKRERIALWRNMAKVDIVLTDAIKENAHRYMNIGLRQVDAAHLACAIAANADYFITTDKKILNKRVDNMKLVNPIVFVEEYLYAN